MSKTLRTLVFSAFTTLTAFGCATTGDEAAQQELLGKGITWTSVKEFDDAVRAGQAGDVRLFIAAHGGLPGKYKEPGRGGRAFFAKRKANGRSVQKSVTARELIVREAVNSGSLETVKAIVDTELEADEMSYGLRVAMAINPKIGQPCTQMAKLFLERGARTDISVVESGLDGADVLPLMVNPCGIELVKLYLGHAEGAAPAFASELAEVLRELAASNLKSNNQYLRRAGAFDQVDQMRRVLDEVVGGQCKAGRRDACDARDELNGAIGRFDAVAAAEREKDRVRKEQLERMQSPEGLQQQACMYTATIERQKASIADIEEGERLTGSSDEMARSAVSETVRALREGLRAIASELMRKTGKPFDPTSCAAH